MAKEKNLSEIPAIAGLTFEELQDCLTLGATLEQVRDLAESGFGIAQIKQLAATLGAARNKSAGGVSASDLREVLEAQRRAMKPENEQHPGISVFSYPEGEMKRPKPTLRRETFFMGAREKEDRLSPLEIELYNRFDRSMSARTGRWTAKIRIVDGIESLWIDVADARTMDGRVGLPGLTLILRELLDGAEAANPDTLAARVAELEAAIRSMSDRQPAGAAA